ncbi:hypothetical protein GGF32_008952 [Allomyces javanicus]|nr:hypothetical protein GGF32_008952 [Allomyces javanicus]
MCANPHPPPDNALETDQSLVCDVCANLEPLHDATKADQSLARIERANPQPPDEAHMTDRSLPVQNVETNAPQQQISVITPDDACSSGELDLTNQLSVAFATDRPVESIKVNNPAQLISLIPPNDAFATDQPVESIEHIELQPPDKVTVTDSESEADQPHAHVKDQQPSGAVIATNGISKADDLHVNVECMSSRAVPEDV